MEENVILNVFLQKLFIFLVGRKPVTNNELKIFRKHNKLKDCGELSFPLNLAGWNNCIKNEAINSKIVEYIEKFNSNQLTNTDFIELINDSKKWNSVSIDNILIEKSKVNIFLNKVNTFKEVISLVLLQKETYGSLQFRSKNVIIKIDDGENSCDLTSLRLKLLYNVIVNILQINSCNVLEDNINKSEIIYLTNKSESKFISKKIVCGVVISHKFGKKNTNILADEFYKKRAVDMQLMAQHKYGVRVTSEPGWADFFKQLGNAAVIIDLMHVKASRPIIVNEECSASTSSKGKGASFILYNCARLAEIFKKFDKKVDAGEIPPLPSINELDFSLLKQPEEWELLYVYVMQYKSTVQSCVADILDCRLNTHNLCVFLDSLCSTFSIYYRRVRVLTEARSHLFPVMHARIYLLKAIQQVLHNALAILDIPPIKQM